MTRKQHFLFLQGVCSPFFNSLAEGLRQKGQVVRKVNFTVGDRIYWRQGNAISFRGPMARLPDFYKHEFEHNEITDIVLFGDCRPVHRPAIELAKQNDVRVHVFEEGYFRPYWITLERGGVNGHSALPSDPGYYRERAKEIPDYDNGTPFLSPFWKRAAYDVGYNFWAGLNPILHTGVQSHVPYSPAAEYINYVRKNLGSHISRLRAQSIQNKLVDESKSRPYYLFPLQLATDSQIVHHSDFSSMSEATDTVIRSFSQYAPENSLLLIKAHPLDPGLVNYGRHIKKLSKSLQIQERVFYIDGGHLPTLIGASTGVVTVNSTVGASALLHGIPTIALGRAIYDIPGLTSQRPLNEFWEHQQQPDVHLFRNFRNVVIHDTQINGGFYCKTGISLSVERCIQKLVATP